MICSGIGNCHNISEAHMILNYRHLQLQYLRGFVEPFTWDQTVRIEPADHSRESNPNYRWYFSAWRI